MIPIKTMTSDPGLAAAMKQLDLSKVYQFIEPGPVVLLTTQARGRPNVMAMSWHMMLEFEPPLMACVVSDANFSFKALRSTKEAVIAIPDRRLADKVVKVGNCSGRTVDKFTAFGLTPQPAREVSPPLIRECFCNLECRVVDTRMVRRYGVFVLEVVKAWIEPGAKRRKMIHHRGYGSFAVDGTIIKLKSAKA